MRHVEYGKKVARAIFMMSGDPSLVPVREERLARLIAQAFLEGQAEAPKHVAEVIDLAEVARRAGA
jgi:hypothetical protein